MIDIQEGINGNYVYFTDGTFEEEMELELYMLQMEVKQLRQRLYGTVEAHKRMESKIDDLFSLVCAFINMQNR